MCEIMSSFCFAFVMCRLCVVCTLCLLYGDPTSFLCCFFFFKQKTAYEMRISDWSSDVCSSDLHEFVPPGSVCFTTLVNEWNDEKVRRLNEQGFPTETLGLSVPDNMRVTSGTEIRRLIRASDPSWARFVPEAVAEIIEEIGRASWWEGGCTYG